MTSSSVVRDRPPEPTALAHFRFPPFVATELANGVRVIVARCDAAPLVSIAVLARAGGQTSPHDQPGLASLHAGLLDEGTRHRDALAIARTIERLGGGLSSGVDWDLAAIQMGMLATHLDAGLALAAEMTFEAQFPVAELDRLRQERLGEILRSRDRPSVLAERAFASALYGDTVYAQPLIGTEASLEAFGRDDILDFNRRHMMPSGLTVLVVGAIDPDEAIARDDAHFAAAPRGGAPPQPAAIEPPAPARRVILVDRPEAAQTELQLGHVSVPRRAPGYPARVLLGTILGGSFTSRLNLNIRERLGLTYGIRCSFARRTGPGPFAVRAAVDTDGTGLAIRETLGEIHAMRDKGVTADELTQAQQFLMGVFPYTVETIGDLAQRIEDLVVFDLPLDYYERHPARLGDVDTHQVAEAAQTLLDPDRATIVAVGPAASLRPQLEPFGAIEVVTP